MTDRGVRTVIKTLLAVAIAGSLSSVCLAFDEAAELEWANETTKEYQGALKSELKAAMHAGGTLEAIQTCNTKALAIGEEMSLANGESVSRVSLRNRNPGNVPNDWQEAVLIEFENRKEAGENPENLTWHEVVETDQGPVFRYMKAIPMAPLCLQCHGTDIAPPVAEKLAELYPDDKATGFEIGDLRGAFVVTRPVE